MADFSGMLTPTQLNALLKKNNGANAPTVKIGANNKVITTPATTNIVPVNNATNTNPTISKPSYDPTADIKSLTELQRQRAIADLGAKRDTSLSALAQQESKVAPMYADKRNQSSTASQLGAKNLAEYMANRGQTTSGISAQLEGQRLNALGNTYAGYNRDEANAINDINAQRTDITRGYANDLASANLGLQASELDKLIQARQRAEELSRADAIRREEIDYQLNRDNVMDSRYTDTLGYERGRDSLMDKRYDAEESRLIEDRQRALELEELERYARSISGLGDQMDYQAEINKFTNDNDPTNDKFIPLLQQERARKLQGMSQAQAQAEEKQAQAEAEQRKQAMDIFESIGVATPEIAQVLGISPGTTTRQYQDMINSNNISWANVNNSRANAERSQANTDRLFNAQYESDGQGGFIERQAPQEAKVTRNEALADEIGTYQGFSAEDSVNYLLEDKEALISAYGISGYKQIWDTALANAIREGQALPYSEYFSY